MTEIEDRPNPTCADSAHVHGCPCQAGGDAEFRLEFSTMGSTSGPDRTYFDFPAGTAGLVLALTDGRTITIADLGTGPVVRVEGPNDELLADWSLPASAQDDSASKPEGGIEQYQAEGR